MDNASCFTCHTSDDGPSLTKRVEGIQEKVFVKTNDVSDVIVELIDEITKAIENNTHSQEIIKKAQDLHRKAQFKWDFVFVENGEGFHNSAKAHKNLDEALELAKEGLNLFK